MLSASSRHKFSHVYQTIRLMPKGTNLHRQETSKLNVNYEKFQLLQNILQYIRKSPTNLPFSHTGRVEVELCSFFSSSLRRCMCVGGQRHAPIALLLGDTVLIVKEGGWSSKGCLIVYGKENISPPPPNEFGNPSPSEIYRPLASCRKSGKYAEDPY